MSRPTAEERVREFLQDAAPVNTGELFFEDAVRALDNNKDMPAETLRIVHGKLASAIDTLDAVRIHRREHSAVMRTEMIEAALEMYHEAAALLGVGL